MAQIAEADLGDVVSFEGWVSDDRLRELLHSADAGIVAQKATPYSHLVSTNKMVDTDLRTTRDREPAEGLSELCDDSTLEFYEPGDPVDLARAIRHLHDDPARREELARNGRRAEQELGWAVQRKKYLGVFDALMSRG